MHTKYKAVGVLMLAAFFAVAVVSVAGVKVVNATSITACPMVMPYCPYGGHGVVESNGCTERICNSAPVATTAPTVMPTSLSFSVSESAINNPLPANSVLTITNVPNGVTAMVTYISPSSDPSWGTGGWLTVSSPTQLTPTAAAITVSAQPWNAKGGLDAGTYTASIQIVEDEHAIYVPVTLTVTAPTSAPAYGALIPSTTFVNFNVVQGASNPSPMQIILTNGSSASVNFTLSMPNQPSWLNTGYNTQQMTLAPGGVMGVGASVDATKVSGPGTYTTNLIVTGDFTNSPITIPITLTVTAATAAVTPTITILSPTGGQQFTPSSSITVNYATSGSFSTLNTLYFVYLKNKPDQLLGNNSVSQTYSAAVFRAVALPFPLVVAIPDSWSGPSYIEIDYTDTNANVIASATSNEFTVTTSTLPIVCPAWGCNGPKPVTPVGFPIATLTSAAGGSASSTSVQAMQQELTQLIAELLQLLQQAAAKGLLSSSQLNSVLSTIPK